MNALKEKMERWLNISQAEAMCQEYMEFIENNKSAREKARIKDKNYPFKIFLEEYIPLIEFSLQYCEDRNSKIRYVGEKTQISKMKYDGEISMPDGSIRTVEITGPIDGKRISEQAQQLNEYGYTETEIYNPFEHIEAIGKMIVEQAEKKASKNYQNSILVIYCPNEINSYLGLDEEIHVKLIDKIIQSLQIISFNAREVYLLIPKYIGSSGSGQAKLIEIKQHGKK